MNPLHFLRMARWARNPPSRNKVLLGLGVVAVCVAIVALESFSLWPDWATTDRMPRRFSPLN